MVVQGYVAVLCNDGGGADRARGREANEGRNKGGKGQLTSRVSAPDSSPSFLFLLALLVALRIWLGLATTGDVLKERVNFVMGVAILDMIIVVVVLI